MSNVAIRIHGTSNVKAIQADFARLEATAEILNKRLEQIGLASKGLVNPGGFARANKMAMESSKIFRDAAASTGMWETEQIRARSATDEYTRALEKQKLSFRDLIKNSKVAKAAYREQLAIQQMVARSLPGKRGGKALVDTAIPTQVSKEYDTLGRKIGWIREQTRSAATQMINWGKNTQWAGRQLMVGFTLPLAAFGAAAGVMAYQVDSEMTRIKKVYDTTANQNDKTTQGMQRTNAEFANLTSAAFATAENAARQYGVSMKDTLGVQADLAATGQKGAALQAATTEVVKNATLGEIDYQTATKATIAMQQTLHMSSSKLADTWAYMNSVENATSLQMKDFAEAIPIALGPLKEMGGNVQTLGTLLTGMVSRGIAVGKAANAIKASMQRLARPSKQIREEFQEITKASITDIQQKNKGNLVGMLRDIYDVTKDLQKQQRQKVFAGLFGSYQVATIGAMVDSMGDLEKGIGQVSKAEEIAGQSTKQWATVSRQELGQMAESASGKFKRAIATLQVQLVAAGEPFLKVAAVAVGAITKILEAFNNLPKGAKYAIVAAAGFMAIVGPVVMLTGLFANFAGNMLKFGVAATRVLGKMELLDKESAAMRVATDLANKGFITQTSSLMELQAALERVNATMLENQAIQREAAGLAPISANSTKARNQARGPDGRFIATPTPTQTAAEEAKGGGGKVFAGSMVTAAAAMGLMAVSSNKVVDDISQMVLIASLLGPALAAIKWAAIATTIAEWGGGLMGAARAAAAFGGKILDAVLAAARFAGPYGILAVVAAGLYVWHKHADDVAQSMQKISDTGSQWAKIFNYTELKPGQVLDPKTGTAVDTLASRVKELNKSAPEVGRTIEVAMQRAGHGISQAAAQAQALNIAIRQGLKVKQSGGTAQQAREAVKTSLMAGVGDINKVDQMMRTVDLRVNFKVNRSVMNQSLQQVAEQLQDAVNDNIARNKYEATWDLWKKYSGFASSLSRGSQEAGKNAAKDFYTAFAAEQANPKNQVQMARDMNSRFEDMYSAAVQGIRGNNKAMDILGVNANDSSAKIGSSLFGLTDKQRSDLEKTGVNFKDILNSVSRVKGEQQAFLKDVGRAAGLSKDQVESLKTMDDLLHKLIPGYKSAADKQKDIKKAQDGYNSALRIANNYAIGGVKKLTDAQKLQILNQYRVQAGLKKTGNLLDGFGPATAKWKGNLDGAGNSVDRANSKLTHTQALMASITDAQITDLAKNAMTSYQQGIADNTTAAMDARADAAIAAVQKQGEARTRAFEARQQAASDALSRRQENASNALQNRQENESNMLENRQERRRKAIEASYDKRINAIQKEIKAEQKADDIRKRLFDAEMTRIDRLNEAQNQNIDFNTALNSGKLDEAAKIRNDMEAKAQEYSMQDAMAAGDVRSQNRQDKMQGRIDRLEKAKDKTLERISKVEKAEQQSLQRRQRRQQQFLQRQQQREQKALQKHQDRERRALQASVDANNKAESKKWDIRKKALADSLKDFMGYIAKNDKDLRKHIKLWQKEHKGMTLVTQGQFDASSEHVEKYLVKNIMQARRQIVNNNEWEKSGANIAKRMIKGAFGLNMHQFRRWMVTGVMPKGGDHGTKSKGPAGGYPGAGVNRKQPRGGGRAPSRHDGGPIGGGKDSRTGVARTTKGLHPSEVMVRARKGEFMVNEKSAAENRDILTAINNNTFDRSTNYHTDGNSDPKKGTGGIGLGISGLMAGAQAAMMKSVIKTSIKSGAKAARAREQQMMISGLFGSPGAAAGLDGAQMKNASIIANVGRGMGMSKRDIEIAFMAALVESNMRNLPYGDRDSIGMFQQRNSWGSYKTRISPEGSSRLFFRALKALGSRRNSMGMGEAAQAVQRSAFPGRYAMRHDQAVRIFEALVRKPGGGYGIPKGGFRQGPGGIHRPIRGGHLTQGIHDAWTGFPAVDIGAPIGTPVYAANDGRVILSKDLHGNQVGGYRSYGRYIEIKHPKGATTLYAHLSKRAVGVGTRVQGGAQIGLSGNTGHTYGAHLHFGAKGTSPYTFLNTGGYTESDGPAYLHKNELVISPEKTEDLYTGLDTFTKAMTDLRQNALHFGQTPKGAPSSSVGNAGSGASPNTGRGFRLRNGTVNIDKDNSAKGMRGDLSRLLGRADVLSLSEYEKTAKGSNLRGWLAKRGWGMQESGGGTYGDTAVIWNSKKLKRITGGGININPKVHGHKGARSRHAAYAELQDRKSGTKFWQVATHLVNHSSPGYPRILANQMYNLGKLYARLSKTAPVFMAGDWNAPPKGYAGGKGTNQGFPYLYSNYAREWFKRGTSPHGSHIDQILTQRKNKFVNSQIVRGLRSDHDALLAQYNIPGLAKGGTIRWDNTIANLHKGERVLSEDLTSKLDRGMSNFANGGGDVYNINVNVEKPGATANEIADVAVNKIRRQKARVVSSRRAS